MRFNFASNFMVLLKHDNILESSDQSIWQSVTSFNTLKGAIHVISGADVVVLSNGWEPYIAAINTEAKHSNIEQCEHKSWMLERVDCVKAGCNRGQATVHSVSTSPSDI